MAGSADAAENIGVERGDSMKESKLESVKRVWYQLSKNIPAVVGIIIVAVVILAAVFAKQIAPYPDHDGAYVNFADAISDRAHSTCLGRTIWEEMCSADC